MKQCDLNFGGKCCKQCFLNLTYVYFIKHFPSPHLLFQVSPAQGHLLLQLLLLALVLRLGLHLDLALVGVEQLHLLLQLLPQGLALGFLGLIQTQLTQPTMDRNRGEGCTKRQKERERDGEIGGGGAGRGVCVEGWGAWIRHTQGARDEKEGTERTEEEEGSRQ